MSQDTPETSPQQQEQAPEQQEQAPDNSESPKLSRDEEEALTKKLRELGYIE